MYTDLTKKEKNDFEKDFFSNRNENKTEILIYKSVCLGLSILELSETLKYCCMTFGMVIKNQRMVKI